MGHDIIEEAAPLARVVEGEDVRMRKPRGDLDFLQEPLDPEERGKTGEQHLQRDLAAMLAVVREIHGRHAAAAQYAAQSVALAERRLEVGGDVRGHGGSI